MLNDRTLLNRLIVLVAACALVLGVAACGGSDDDDGGAQESASTPATDSGGAPLSNEEQVRATLERLYQGHRDSDPEAVCAELSGPAKTQVIQGDLGGEKVTCEKSFEQFFEASEGSDQKRTTLSAKIGKVRINGKHAVASVKFRTGSGKIPLIKIDGEWKLDAVGAAQPSS